MKLKFWQKTYIFTLLLFLLFLNVGVFSLAVYTHSRNEKSALDSAKAEQHYIAASFERDKEDLDSGGEGADPVLLMRTYCGFYEKRGVLLEFRYKNGTTAAGRISDGVRRPEAGSYGYETIDGARHIIIAQSICENEFSLIYASSLAQADSEFRSLMIFYLAVSFAVSSLLAVLLYLVLRKLSVPLEKLRSATETIARGDYSVRADENAEGEFGELGKSFNAMVDKVNGQIHDLKQNAETKQRLVEDLAHELRTPLTSIYGYAEYLRRTKTDEDEKIECLISIMSESKRLQNICEKLLDTAYIRENAINKTGLRLAGIICDTAKMLSETARARGVTISTDCDETTVLGDETLLSMLFYNLAENAIKACGEGGRVTLSCRSGAARVADNGKGMTAEQLSHITEPFYRTDRSRSRAEGGAGLGLTLCSQIAQAHSAALEFDSKPNEGTVVNVRFTNYLALDDNTITT